MFNVTKFFLDNVTEIVALLYILISSGLSYSNATISVTLSRKNLVTLNIDAQRVLDNEGQALPSLTDTTAHGPARTWRAKLIQACARSSVALRPSSRIRQSWHRTSLYGIPAGQTVHAWRRQADEDSEDSSSSSSDDDIDEVVTAGLLLREQMLNQRPKVAVKRGWAALDVDGRRTKTAGDCCMSSYSSMITGALIRFMMPIIFDGRSQCRGRFSMRFTNA